ncbi:glycosyltransferase family 4 protein [Vibrio hyugaensis]|uniref:glycosyltransferase family 4 protein n=1 Tax=Vibrio hyugaensis TaxID=1534743 RepID=UPI0005F06E59|nr:glycosyltransferase family 4 protein [Vibrio hyugaensis]
MKKVAFITPSYPVLSETFIQTEVDAIQACGHDVTVFTFEIEPCEAFFNYDVIEIGSHIQAENWNHLHIPGFFKACSFAFKQSGIPKKSLMGTGLKLAMQLADQGIGHVHAHFCQHTAAHAIVAAKLLNISCSFVAHGHDVYESPFDVKEKINASDFTIAVCDDMYNDFKSMTNGNVKLLHCGVKPEQFTPEKRTDSDQLRLVFLGRFVEQKGLQYLLEALVPIANKLNVHLDVIGTGPMKKEFVSLTSQLGLTHCVSFLGAKPHSWVKENLSKYDCLVAPFCFSRTGCVDTGPLVLKEAMAVGTPVITSNVMGCKEIVTNETGLFVKQHSIEDITQCINQFAELPQNKRKEMGKCGRQRVLKYFNAYRQAQKLSQWIEQPNSN